MKDDLLTLLKDFQPQSCDLAPHSVFYTDKTPSYDYATIVFPIFGTKYFAVLASRNGFNEKLARTVIETTNGNTKKIVKSQLIRILQNSLWPNLVPFDSVACLSPSVANHFETVGLDLNMRCFRVFPVYHCEFSGSETAVVLNAMTHGTICTIDWNRNPEPKVLLKYKTSTAGTRGDKYYVDKFCSLLQILKSVHQDAGTLSIINYADEVLQITVFNKRASVSCKCWQSDNISFDKCFDFVRQFVYENSLPTLPG